MWTPLWPYLASASQFYVSCERGLLIKFYSEKFFWKGAGKERRERHRRRPPFSRQLCSTVDLNTKADFHQLGEERRILTKLNKFQKSKVIPFHKLLWLAIVLQQPPSANSEIKSGNLNSEFEVIKKFVLAICKVIPETQVLYVTSCYRHIWPSMFFPHKNSVCCVTLILNFAFYIAAHNVRR